MKLHELLGGGRIDHMQDEKPIAPENPRALKKGKEALKRLKRLKEEGLGYWDEDGEWIQANRHPR